MVQPVCSRFSCTISNYVLCQCNGGACVNAEFHNILLPVQERPCKEQYTEKLRQSNERKHSRTPEKTIGSRIVATLRAMVVSHYMEISLRIVRHNKVRHNTRSAACRSTDVQYAEGQNLTTKTSHSDSAQNASATTNTVPTTYIPTSM